jgi:Domain of Unknown Function with PDB structure (DUF3857)/Transglutaminase-like superfamily
MNYRPSSGRMVTRRTDPVCPGLLRAALLGALALPAVNGGQAQAGMFLFERGVKLPQWMQEQLSAPLPAHDDKAEAVVLYADTLLAVERTGKLHRTERRVYRILRPKGEERGTVWAISDSRARVISMRGWSAPTTGKPYEVKDDEAVEVGVPGAELVTDLRMKTLHIPAAIPGSVVGYEVQTEEQPYVLLEKWAFQDTLPVHAVRYTLQLPPGWQFKATWLNHADQPPVSSASGWQWSMSDVKGITVEPDMAPWQATAGQMWLALLPPGGKDAGPQTWQEIGTWYVNLTGGRRDATPEIRQKVAELTSGKTQTLEKIRSLAAYVQSDIRYVAIELGIGGYQPHAAGAVLANRYGDCKDKVTLLSSMLKEIGVDSSYLIVNAQRGWLSSATPPNLGFNHVVLGIQLAAVEDPSLMAVTSIPGLGRVLVFDPTDPYTPLGSISGALQGGYGLLAASEGGVLIQLPELPASASGTQRTGQMTLEESGTLRGEIREVLTGDRAAKQRAELGAATQDPNHARTVESHIGSAFATFQILRATVTNLRVNDRPIEWDFSLEVPHYAKSVGDLLVVRPRILGTESSAALETPEPRKHGFEFSSRLHNTDSFEISLPPGYRVDDLPPPVDVDYDFATYHSRIESTGHTLRYTRTLEIRELSVPLGKIDKLRELFRLIRNDERAEAVLKHAS